MNFYYQSIVTHPFSVSRIQTQPVDVLPDVSPNTRASCFRFILYLNMKLYETAKNCSRKNVMFENIFADLQFLLSFGTHGRHLASLDLFRFHGFTWDQPRPKLPLLPPKRLGTTVRATQLNDAAPENEWLEDYVYIPFGMSFWKVRTVSFRGCNFPGVVFFWKVGSDYHWISCGSSQDSSIGHSPVVTS